MSKKITDKMKKEIVESELDDMFEDLIEDIQASVTAISDGSTVLIDNKYVPNSKLAVEAAKNLLAVSVILEVFEEDQEEITR